MSCFPCDFSLAAILIPPFVSARLASTEPLCLPLGHYILLLYTEAAYTLPHTPHSDHDKYAQVPGLQTYTNHSAGGG